MPLHLRSVMPIDMPAEKLSAPPCGPRFGVQVTEKSLLEPEPSPKLVTLGVTAKAVPVRLPVTVTPTLPTLVTVTKAGELVVIAGTSPKSISAGDTVIPL